MYRRIVSFVLTGYLFLVFINWSCTKIDTTTLGGDLIPEVDNVNTFADTLDIISSQGVFDDTTRLSLYESYTLGKITNDPLLGQTDAKLFIQFKPSFYPYYFGIPNDTIIGVDSVVLCLNYKGFYGDSVTPLRFTVDEVSDQQHGEWDSLGSFRTIKYAPQISGSLVDQPKTVQITQLPNWTRIRGGKDSVQNQVRIKLSNQFANELIQGDTTVIGNGIFKNDSIFKTFMNGFAISTLSGNALLYTDLTSAQTRLEVHYRRKHGNGPDTTFAYFFYTDIGSGSGATRVNRGQVANNIIRNRPGLPSGDQQILLQTTPGTYANLTIPELTGYSNRIIHRAEINIEQIPDNPVYDSMFPAPNYLYLDLIDSTTGTPKWKPVYFDLNPSSPYDPDYKTGLPFFPSGGVVDFGYYGGYLRKKAENGQWRYYYHFNITRHVQQIVTHSIPNYSFRLFAPQSFSYPQYLTATNTTDILSFIPYNNSIAYGRIKVGGGQNSNPQYKMRLRVIYSNIK